MLPERSVDRQGDYRPASNGVSRTGQPMNSNFSVAGTAAGADRRLLVSPNNDHKPDSYDDLRLDYKASVFSSLEKHLPSSMLGVSRDAKIRFMSEILARYLPDGERLRVQKHREYRMKILSNYQPLHKTLYNMQPAAFFVPSFLNAIRENTEESLRSIIREPSPGIYTFAMLQPTFCELLLAEVDNFEKWVQETKCKIMRPNTMNKYGAVLDDFGMESMLTKLMDDFVCPLSRVFFPEVGGCSLDSHHGFVVEYGEGKDSALGFHVDDSEVTLNICLGKHFSGGELYFRGVRCDKHVNSDTLPEEIFDYSHVRGQAILHRGRHRHGARCTSSGNRINLLLWCRSSVFRELTKYQKDFSGWCGECAREKKARQQKIVAATKVEILGREGEPVT